MSWATEEDLLTGDINFAGEDPTKFLALAADEINAHLGSIYVLPIPPLAEHNTLTLKIIQTSLASGRLLLAFAASGEDAELHAYGIHLVERGYADLDRLGRSTQLVDVNGVQIPTNGPSGADSRVPTINIGPDMTAPLSPFDIYEQRTHGGSLDYWTP